MSADGAAATIYLNPEEFGADAAEVTGGAHRHLFRARRLAVGDRLRAVDGIGHARAARVVAVERRSARLELGAPLESRESRRRLTIVVPMPRPERASWLVEKATELGVAEIAWLKCARSVRTVSDSALARHRRVAISALEQCGREVLPAVTGPHAWADLPDMVAGFDSWWLLDPAGEVRPVAEAGADAVGLVIGPEGGWEAGERREAKALGGVAWSLGSSVLRVETAAVAGSTLLLAAAPAP